MGLLSGCRIYTAIAALVLAVWVSTGSEYRVNAPTPTTVDYDPCCEFPCKHDGICMSFQDRSYYCDCTYTEYYGVNCTTPEFLTMIKTSIKPDPAWMHRMFTTDMWLWRVINNIPCLSNLAMRYVFVSRGAQIDTPTRYESDHHYSTLDSFFNETYYGRTLPPIPPNCPTAMGAVGPKELPTVEELVKRVFTRSKFIPEPHDTNAMFQYYAQHFSHMFFRTNYTKGPGFTKGSGGVDVSNIYGLTEKHRRALRLNKDGKLRYKMIDGEMYPPHFKDVKGIELELPPKMPVKEENLFALGHPFFVLLPGLFMYATIWLREHNRVCDVLKKEHADWQDERLYHTARLIITGEVIKITIEDYVQHLSQYKVKLRYNPEVVHGTTYQWDNRIHAEFDHLYHWHPLVPEIIKVENTSYGLMDMAYSVKPIFTHGMDKFIHAMANTRAGQLGARNHPPATIPILSGMIENSRKLRFQSFNNYRLRFDMPAFTSFEDLTGEKELAAELEYLYKDVDAVEYYVGLLAERPSPSVTPLTMVNIGGPWSVKGLISNPVGSPKFWKPSTFGGEVGFNILKEASFKNLFCYNMKNKKDCEKITFAVPAGAP